MLKRFPLSLVVFLSSIITQRSSLLLSLMMVAGVSYPSGLQPRVLTVCCLWVWVCVGVGLGVGVSVCVRVSVRVVWVCVHACNACVWALSSCLCVNPSPYLCGMLNSFYAHSHLLSHSNSLRTVSRTLYHFSDTSSDKSTNKGQLIGSNCVIRLKPKRVLLSDWLELWLRWCCRGFTPQLLFPVLHRGHFSTITFCFAVTLFTFSLHCPIILME